MLNDIEIEGVIQPFVERQQALNEYVINQIAKSIKEVGSLSKEDVRRLTKLLKIGANAQLVTKEIANVLNRQETAVKQAIREVARVTYKDAKPFYDYRHKKQIPFEKNMALQKSVRAIGEQTGNTFKNLSNSKATGFLIRDLKHPNTLQFQNVTSTYQSIIDEAVQAVQSGVLPFDTAMRRTLRQLNASGLRRAYWDTGVTRRLDSVVRMNVLSGVRQINQKVQQQIAKEINADGIELSAHSFSAPDHEPIQGRIFTKDNFNRMQSEMPFEDIDGNKYPAMRRPIGEWNCKHFTQAIVIGAKEPTWSNEDLQELIDANKEGYTTPDGRHYTMYECTQLQREYETKIRYAKEGYIMARNAGNESLMEEYQAKLADLNKQYRQFSKDCGLRVQRNRTYVPDFS